MKRTILALAVLSLGTATAFADEHEAEVACPESQAYTIFVEDKTGNRKGGSADRLTQEHRNAEKQGWEFEDLEIYIEDGDLQGFFVTYTRPHPCGSKNGD